MNTANARAAALVTFGALAMFYLGSVIFQVISWGWSWTFEATRTEPTLAYSLASRTLGGLIALVVFVLCIGGRNWRQLRTYLAWILTLGVVILVVTDNLSPQSERLGSRTLVWLIAAGIVAIHVFGAIVARRASNEAF
jgi:hypothetical protein